MLVLVAVAMVTLLAAMGVALDSGRGYLLRIRLTRAVDAGALTGARTLRSGQDVAEEQARATAAANGVADGEDGVALSVSFDENEEGEQTVTVSAERDLPTILMKLLGFDFMDVSAVATAAVPPVDLTLVVDQSGSLGSAGAWDDLQDAAKQFVDQFDDEIDQMGLVSFQVRATTRLGMTDDFTAPVKAAIDDIDSAGDTNPGEAFRLAHAQITGPAARDRSAKVVVFFTDGRPTAIRGSFGGEDRIMAVYTTGNVVRGYFNDPDDLDPDEVANPPNGCFNVFSCFTYNHTEVREQGRQDALAWADQIRDEGIFIYSIGLGNPFASNPLLVPDLDFLREIANENGQTDSTQPTGRAYFAPSAAELEEVFNQVAQDLLVRLAR